MPWELYPTRPGLNFDLPKTFIMSRPRTPIKPRNRMAVAMWNQHFGRSGSHNKNKKAQRKADRQALLKEVTEQ